MPDDISAFPSVENTPPQAQEPPPMATYVNPRAHTFSLSKPSFRVLLVVALTIVLIIGSVFLSSRIPRQTKKESLTKNLPTNSSIQKHNITRKQALEKTVDALLTSSKDKEILSYLNMAKIETNYDARYKHYVTAYKGLATEYSSTKDTKYAIAMSQLKEYLKVFPQYKETDFTI